MTISCIIETVAEVPVFIAQVFCFVKLKVVLDTLHIFVRSVLFIWFVLRDPNNAIYAFSIAQVGSTIAFLIGYYGYFYYYIGKSKTIKGSNKRKSDENQTEKIQNGERNNDPIDTIPFNSILELMPGYLVNTVGWIFLSILMESIK